MRRRETALLVCCSAVALAVVSGCDALESRQALSFNDAVAHANTKLTDGAAGFRRSMKSALAGQAGGAAQVKHRYDTLDQLLDEIEAETKALKIPGKESARKLYVAQQNYLRRRRQAVRTDYAKIVKIIGDENLGSEQKQLRIMPIVARVARAEQADIRPLQEAQRAFAEDFGITLR